ncbi:MAG: DUF92 domain-containing protein [Anaerolineae bacterium]|nr:MAG: DUF92 domain-containing protein [Anaerolineae bacterium]
MASYPQFVQILAGIVLGTGVAWGAWRAGALSSSGGWAAAILGALVFGAGGIAWAILLLAFFLTSSGLSRLFQRRKHMLHEKFAKGSQRDAMQVLSNGGVLGLCVLVHAAWPQVSWPWAAAAGALAAVNADTWATEAGVLSKARPRLITTGKVVERGTSGGITPLGTLATLGGAALLGGLAGLYAPAGDAFSLGAAVTLGGVAGSLLDSLLGATLQGMYRCPRCATETEHHPRHTCGTPTERVRGLAWLNNDAVNLLASLCGALVAASLWGIIFP